MFGRRVIALEERASGEQESFLETGGRSMNDDADCQDSGVSAC